MSVANPLVDAEVEPGIEVGPWMVESLLGEGGMALVFSAQHNVTGDRGALKVLRGELAGQADVVARFVREARVLRSLEHPGVVPVLDTGKLAGGRPWLVLAELTGCTLRAALDQRGRLAPTEAWPIARAILDALAVAHAAGVVHRDLKPGNIFLEGARAAASIGSARPRLLDFGLAKVDERLDQDAVRRVTQSGAPVGTPAYMAPEQWWGRDVDGRTDLYGLGATLFELLAGEPPYKGETYAQLVEHVLHDPVPSLRGRVASVSPAVDAFVARLLAREPIERFANAWIARAAGDEAFDGSAAGVGPDAASATPPLALTPTPASVIAAPPPPPAPIPMLAPTPTPARSDVAPIDEMTRDPGPARARARPAPPPRPAADEPPIEIDLEDEPTRPEEVLTEDAGALSPGPVALPPPPAAPALELDDAAGPAGYPVIPRPSPLPAGVTQPPTTSAHDDGATGGARDPTRPRLTPISADDYTPRYLRTHVAVAVIGVLAIVGLGYAGSAPRDVLGWMRDGGWGMVPIVLGFFAVAGLVPRFGVRRAMLGAPVHAGFGLAALPVVMASIGTWLSWGSVREAIGPMEPAHAFVTLHVGVVEAHVPRFVGFALGAVSFLLLAALPTRRFREQRMSAWRVADIAAGGLAGLAVLALFLGARSGAFVAGVAAAGTFLGRGLSLAPTRIRWGEAVDHAVASLVATLLAIGAAFARLDARVAAPFGDEGITRAARVEAILAATLERNLSRFIAAVAVSTVLGIAAMRLIRLKPSEGRLRLPRSGIAVLLAMPAFFGLDAAASAVFHAKRDELDALLAPQFSLMAELVPPQARGGWLATPVDAPALQITSSTIAVEGRPVARADALAAEATRDGVVQEIARAVAANPPSADHPDLALLADRAIPWPLLEGVLRLARQAGARKIDVLLTRGDPVAVPKGAPPEASAVTPSDFATLRVEIAVAGGRRVEGATFDAVATEWLAERASAAPIVVGVGW